MKSGSFKSVAVLALLLALVLSVMPSVAQSITPRSVFRGDAAEIDALEAVNDAQLVRDAQGRVAYTVVLSEAPASQAVIAAGGPNVAGAANIASAQRQVVSAQQSGVLSTVSALGGVKYSSGNYLANYVGIYLDPAQVPAIRAMPGVKTVFPSVPMIRADTTSTKHIGATEAWESTKSDVTGDGLIIAIIDSGIDFSHTHFGGTGDYATEIGDGTGTPVFGAFPIANVGDQKVIGGYDWVGDDYDARDAEPIIAPDVNPADCPVDLGGGHGTHVAGSAAGYGVLADGSTYVGTLDGLFDATYPGIDTSFRIGPGVAPRAALLALRIFGCDGSTLFTPDAIEAAAAGGVDTDEDDILDVTFPVPDVINMSLGSAYGSSASDAFYNDIIDNAVALGITVVASAGNSGDTYFITGSPGATNAAMSVANTTDTTDIGGAIDVTVSGETTRTFAVYSDVYSPGPFAPFTVTDFIRPDGTTNGNTQLGCAAGDWPVDLGGATVIIDRGSCNFSIKNGFAFQRNAGAVIMVSTGAAIAMGGDPIGGYDLVSVMVSAEDGAVLKADLAAGTLEEVTFDASLFASITTVPNTPSASTSRGPGYGTRIGLKPDVASVGSQVTSARSGSGSGLYTISGTSMAAPHAAGVIALIAEKYPSLTAIQRKMVAMNTATTLVTDVSGTVFYSPQRVGTGVTNVEDAMNTTVLAYSTENPDGVSVRFDHYNLAAGEAISATKSITLENWGAADVTYDVAVVDLFSDISGLDFSVSPNVVTVPAGGSASVDVTLSGSLDTDSAALLSDATNPLLTNFWQIPEESALVQFANQGDGSDLHVATYASARLGSDVAATVDTLNLNGLGGVADVPVGGSGLFISSDYEFTLSLSAVFELAWEAPAASDLTDAIGQLEAVGTSHDFANDRSYFAIVHSGAQLSPLEVDTVIYIDYDGDGTADNSITSGIASAARPLACNAAESPSCLLVNDYYQQQVNTYAFGGTRVQVWPVDVAEWDPDDSTTTYKYWVETTNPGDDSVISTTDVLDGDYGKAAYTSIGTLTNGSASFPVSITGLGDPAFVAYDFEGYTDAPDMLVIHHHNADSAPSYEVIDVVIDTDSSFALLSPANNAMVFNPGDVTAVTWEKGNHNDFTWTLMQISGNTPIDGVTEIGVVAEVSATATASDSDGLVCDLDVCTLDVSASTPGLETGTYAWTVVGSPGTENEAEAYNGPYQFTVYRNTLELIDNGDFEDDIDSNRVPDSWRLRGNINNKSKLFCDSVKKPAQNGSCAVFFHRSEPAARLIQKSTVGEVLGAGVTIDAGLYVDTNKSAMNGVMKVKIVYEEINPSTGRPYRDTLKVDVSESTTGYEYFSNSLTTDYAVAKMKVIIRNVGTTGKALVDNANVTVQGADGVAPIADFAADLLPVPEAPADFRGRD